jgi:hypothetical protein
MFYCPCPKMCGGALWKSTSDLWGMLTNICCGETVSYVRISQQALRCRCLLGKEWKYCSIPWYCRLVAEAKSYELKLPKSPFLRRFSCDPTCTLLEIPLLYSCFYFFSNLNYQYPCEFLGFRRVVADESVRSGKVWCRVTGFLTFRDSFVISDFSVLEEKGVMLFRKVGNRLPSDAATHPRSRQTLLLANM